MKASFLGFIGIAFIMSTHFISWKYLHLPLFLIGLFIIALGFRPYKKLSKLILSPDEIHIDDEFVQYYSKGKIRYQIRKDSITDIRFQNGIYLELPNKVIFLPYFKETDFKVLLELSRAS